MDTDLCDSACWSNPYITVCTSKQAPHCVSMNLGNGIYWDACDKRSARVSLKTTPPVDPREFRTMIVVDGAPLSTFISSFSTSVSETITTDTTTDGTTSPTHGPNIGAIVGGVLGGLAIIGLVALGMLVILFLRRRKRNKATPLESSSRPAPQVHPQSDTPNTNDIMASPAHTELSSVTTNPPVKPQGHTISPHPRITAHGTCQTTQSHPIYGALSPGPVQMYELDEGRPDHHRGSIQEIQ